MRSNTVPHKPSKDLRRLLERLDGLPIRPRTAHSVLDRDESQESDESTLPARKSKDRAIDPTELDPGWVLAKSCGPGETAESDLGLVARLTWWRSSNGAMNEALQRLWRHSVAASLAARRLATDAGDPSPQRVAQAALLAHLGLWAWAAVEPGGFTDWLNERDPRRRRDLEREHLGTDHVGFSIRLAERLGCDPLVTEAIWTTGTGLDPSIEPDGEWAGRLSIIRQALELAGRTPWNLEPHANREGHTSEPRIRLLIAEVQARCAGAFVEADAAVREEKLARENAKLRLSIARLSKHNEARSRFLTAYASSPPLEEPEAWAEQAGLAWCDEPGVAAARVVWCDGSRSETRSSPRPPSVVIPLKPQGRVLAEVHLWTDRPGSDNFQDHPAIQAWSAWAGEVSARNRLLHRLESARSALENRQELGEPEMRQAKLAALAEFAGGAGHELNNPLAVIVGRAQLLLIKQADPDAVRSLRTIISQAQRTSRILRDLMYVARPPEPRPKLCQPDEILKNSIRDLQGEAETRSVRLVADLRPEAQPRVWADPDQLRQVADCLIRNAMEATPAGGRVTVTGSGNGDRLEWSIRDEGRGLSETESIHLFDPFFCGRQAGRGLGMGLPRLSRILERSNGELNWTSTTGKGSTFQVSVPLAEPPRAVIQATIERESQVRSA